MDGTFGSRAGGVRLCTAEDAPAILALVNAAAEAYRGVIPHDCWREPYMSAEELTAELAGQVVFSGVERDGVLVGVMGVQRRLNVELVRHAYVLPGWQACGVGSRLLQRLVSAAGHPILVGAWRAAEWAVRFYEGRGFRLAPASSRAALLRTYWRVPDRQVASSVVLCSPALDDVGAERLMSEAHVGASRTPDHPAPVAEG